MITLVGVELQRGVLHRQRHVKGQFPVHDDFHCTIDDAVFKQGGVIEKMHQMVGCQSMLYVAPRRLDGRMCQIRQKCRREPVAGLQLQRHIVGQLIVMGTAAHRGPAFPVSQGEFERPGHRRLIRVGHRQGHACPSRNSSRISWHITCPSLCPQPTKNSGCSALPSRLSSASTCWSANAPVSQVLRPSAVATS
ncbi:hypothetical protein D3C81_1066110 [compost metagenome]